MSLIQDIKKELAPCTFTLILVNIAVFITETILDLKGGPSLSGMFALSWYDVFDGHEYYRLLTYMFLHGSVAHIFNNMLVLGFLGSTVERLIGRVRMLAGYLGSGLIAGLASAIYSRWVFQHTPASLATYHYSVGASGAVFGLTGALIWMVLVNRGYIEGISIRRLLLFAALSIYSGFTSEGIDNAAHIAGAVFGFIGATILYIPRERRRGRNA